MKRIVFAAVGATLLASLALGVASAHAELDHCTPAAGSTVATAPAQIVCVYSEEIDTQRSIMSVWDANGSQVDKKDAHVDLNDPDHKTLMVSLDASLVKNGLFTVQWRVVTPDDNGLSFGSWQFVIGSSNTAPYQPTQVLGGEVNAQGTVVATAAAPTATAAASVAAATAAATVVPSATAASPSTEAPAATATTAAPSTVPSTGGAMSSAWMLLAFLGIVVVIGGMMIRARR